MRRKIIQVFGLILLGTLAVDRAANGWSEPKIFDSLSRLDSSDVDDQGHSSSILSDEEIIENEDAAEKIDGKISWRAPNYANQNGALGWTPEAFNIPKGMEDRVQFWQDIYTKFSTHQGIIHDSVHVSVVYDKVDFTTIEADKNLSDRQRHKAKKLLVDGKKKDIRTILEKLEKIKDPSSLAGEEKRIWDLFANISEPNKFKEATQKRRLRFQLGQSDRFLKGIFYSGRYLPEMERIFRERGLPIELTRLPFVESSFNVKAKSRVGASGIWQFMRYTGRKFVRIHFGADERNDPLRATEAAARMFRINYEMLKDWPLAVTGYNHGPTGVLRVTRKFRTREIAELVDERSGRFGFASANFYASFLAALKVESEAKKYFGNRVFWDEPIPAQEYRLSERLSRKTLLNWFDGDEGRAQDLNPHLSNAFWRGHTSLSKSDFIRVPIGKSQTVLRDLAQIKELGGSNRETNDNLALNYYLIGQGETLSEIAAQVGVSVRAILELNEIDNPRRIRAGQKIKLPNKQ